jgi:hypothetical protein
MMYCQKCGLFFMDDASICHECGEALSPTVKPEFADAGLDPPAGSGFGAPQEMGVSPKKRNVVILLCYFFGIFGVHRFYLGKIMSGIFMILTFGGLTIWCCIDFVRAVTAPFTDSKGREVSKEYNEKMVHILIAAPLILLIIILVVLFFVASAWFRQGNGLDIIRQITS